MKVVYFKSTYTSLYLRKPISYFAHKIGGMTDTRADVFVNLFSSLWWEGKERYG